MGTDLLAPLAVPLQVLRDIRALCQRGHVLLATHIQGGRTMPGRVQAGSCWGFQGSAGACDWPLGTGPGTALPHPLWGPLRDPTPEEGSPSWPLGTLPPGQGLGVDVLPSWPDQRPLLVSSMVEAPPGPGTCFSSWLFLGGGCACPGVGTAGCSGSRVRHQHSTASSAQRPYDIHSSDAVESLVQLFSTVSVQYVPSWSKEMVALLRKVSPSQSAGPQAQAAAASLPPRLCDVEPLVHRGIWCPSPAGSPPIRWPTLPHCSSPACLRTGCELM